MRIVVQRVYSASVTSHGEVVGKIGKGLLLLVGFKDGDTEERLDFAAARTAKLRIFRDENGKLNRSVLDEGGEILVVSNFTLYGDCNHGNRPDFGKSAHREVALPLYEKFIEKLSAYAHTEKGAFGERMELAIDADGPVTLIFEP